MEQSLIEFERQGTEIISQRSIKERMKKSEDSLRDLWNTIMRTTVSTVECPEGEEREKGRKLIQQNNG